jgi:hypothetical protein
MPNAPFVPGSGFIRYVAVGDAGTILTATDDSVGVVWTPVPPSAFTPAPPVQNLLAVTAGGATGTRFLAVGQGGTAVFGDSVISGVALTSIQWFVATQPQTEDLSSVHFFLGQYLAVGPAGGNAVSH